MGCKSRSSACTTSLTLLRQAQFPTSARESLGVAAERSNAMPNTTARIRDMAEYRVSVLPQWSRTYPYTIPATKNRSNAQNANMLVTKSRSKATNANSNHTPAATCSPLRSNIPLRLGVCSPLLKHCHPSQSR